jgi:uncharacterized protein
VNRRLFDAPAESREQVVQALVDAVCGQLDLVFAYLHGSFLTDLPFHDIDVAVFVDAKAGGATARALELAEQLTRATGYPVDIRAINHAPLAFQFRALQGRLLVVHDEQRLADIMERVGRLYLDIAPVWRRATREAFAR